jgi:hypothetical protein
MTIGGCWPHSLVLLLGGHDNNHEDGRERFNFCEQSGLSVEIIGLKYPADMLSLTAAQK